MSPAVSAVGWIVAATEPGGSDLQVAAFQRAVRQLDFRDQVEAIARFVE